MKFITMKVFTSKDMYIWFLVSILSPVAVPYFFAMLMNILIITGKDWVSMLQLIWHGGAYIFLSLFGLVSLVPHFFDTPAPETKVTVIYVFLTVIVLIITCFLYLSSLSLVPDEFAVHFSEHFHLSMWTTIIGVLFAIGIKYYFVQKKIKSRNVDFFQTDYSSN